jgi:hypothetical protein
MIVVARGTSHSCCRGSAAAAYGVSTGDSTVLVDADVLQIDSQGRACSLSSIQPSITMCIQRFE